MSQIMKTHIGHTRILEKLLKNLTDPPRVKKSTIFVTEHHALLTAPLKSFETCLILKQIMLIQYPNGAIILTMSIQDRVSIITGAGRGVGRATALRFAREGARVVLFSRTAFALEEVAAEVVNEGHTALSIAGDVSIEEDVQNLFQRAMETFGRIDILVNCAGIVAVRPFV